MPRQTPSSPVVIMKESTLYFIEPRLLSPEPRIDLSIPTQIRIKTDQRSAKIHLDNRVIYF